jgi:hypothetical protein
MRLRSWVAVGASLCLSLAILAYVVVPESGDAQVTTDPVLVGTGDIARCNGSGDEATAELVAGIDGTVFTAGDNAYQNGTSKNFTDCYDPTWGRHKARTKPGPGNHEYHTAGASGYFNYFGAAVGEPGKGYYSYDLGDWHIVVLNSNCDYVDGGCSIGSPQHQWLVDDLAAHPSTCTLAYWHHPRFSSGQHGNSVSVAPFWRELYASGADVILNGHDHVYERFAPQNPAGHSDPTQGIRQFVVGTGGADLTAFRSIQPNSVVHIANTLGVLKLVLHPEGYEWEFRNVPSNTMPGPVADSGSATCSTAQPPTSSDTAAPTVQAPRQDLPVGSTLGTSTIPTKISWSSADDGSGVASQELQRSTNGGAFKPVSISSATTTSKTLQLAPGSTNQFRVRAIDGAGNLSDWATGPAFTVEARQENSSMLEYTGSTWAQVAQTSAYGGEVRYTDVKGSMAQLTFTGQNVSLVATKGPNRGKAIISIDGAPGTTVDLYDPGTKYRKTVFSRSGLDPAVDHTIAVQVLGTKRSASTGTRVDIDAFVVLR